MRRRKIAVPFFAGEVRVKNLADLKRVLKENPKDLILPLKDGSLEKFLAAISSDLADALKEGSDREKLKKLSKKLGVTLGELDKEQSACFVLEEKQLKEGVEPKDSLVVFKRGEIEIKEGLLLIPDGTTVKGQGLNLTLIKAPLVVLGRNCKLSDLTIEGTVLSADEVRTQNAKIIGSIKVIGGVSKSGESILLKFFPEADGKVVKAAKLDVDVKEKLKLINNSIGIGKKELLKGAKPEEGVVVLKEGEIKLDEILLIPDGTTVKGQGLNLTLIKAPFVVLGKNCKLSDLTIEGTVLSADGVKTQNAKVIGEVVKIQKKMLSKVLTKANGKVTTLKAEVLTGKVKKTLEFKNSVLIAKGLIAKGAIEDLIEEFKFKFKFKFVELEGIKLKNCVVFMIDCKFEGFIGKTAVTLSNSQAFFKNCLFKGFSNKAVGVEAKNSSRAFFKNCSFKDFSGSGTYGVRTRDSAEATLEDCAFVKFEYRAKGLEASANSKVSLKNCSFKDFSGLGAYGVVTWDSAEAKLEGCYFKSFEHGAEGVEVREASKVVLTDCSFKNFKDRTYGVWATGDSVAILKNCSFEDFISATKTIGNVKFV